MFEYIVGKISYANENYLILENNYTGYKIWTNNADSYENNTNLRLYIYTKIFQSNKGNYVYEYYGFKNISEKIFFENLVSINGIGPKTALSILKNDINFIKDLIRNDDIISLELLPGFSNKIALLVCSQLGYKLRNEKKEETVNSTNNGNLLADVISALKALGYKKNDIEMAVNVIGPKLDNYTNDDISTVISEAIKVILGGDESSSIKA